LKKYHLTDNRALVLLGKIVNGADTDNTLYQQPEGPGLEAIAEGFRHLGYGRSRAQCRGNGSSTTRSMPIARKWSGRESPAACLSAGDLPGHVDVNRKCKHWDSAEMQVAPAAQAFHRPTRCNSTAMASSLSGMLTIVERNHSPAATTADPAPIRLMTRRTTVGSKAFILDLRNKQRFAKLYLCDRDCPKAKWN
jgi:hypothetical protein